VIWAFAGPTSSGFPPRLIGEIWGMREQKITLGEMRQSGVHGLLIYCSDYRCSYHLKISADAWPDEVRLSDLEPRFVCKACGTRGADIRPNFAPARMGTSGVQKEYRS
jgi:hypothetical protein